MCKKIVIDTREVVLGWRKADEVVSEVNAIIEDVTSRYEEVTRDAVTVQGDYEGKKIILYFERYATEEEIKKRAEKKEKIRNAVQMTDSGILIDCSGLIDFT